MKPYIGPMEISGVSKNSGTPKSSIWIYKFNKLFHYKPSILGYHYFLETPIIVLNVFLFQNLHPG